MTETDLVHREFAVRSDDLDQEFRRVGDAHGIGAECAQAYRAKLGIAADDRVLGTPFKILEPGRVDEIHLGFERRAEAVIPVLQRRHDRHVVGL